MPENIAMPAAGGMGPGKPVTRQAGTQTSGGVKESVGSARPVETAPSQKAAAQAPAVQPETISKPTPGRQLTVADLSAHLLSMQIPDTDFNLQFSSMLLRYGIELSRENISKALTMLQGTDKSISQQEAVMVLLSKGITENSDAVKILGHYLSSNPQLASQILSMKQSMGNLSNALSSLRALLDTNLVGQLSSLLSQFEKTLDDMEQGYSFNSKSPASDRTEFMLEMRALRALLKALQGKAGEKSQASDAEKQELLNTLNSTLNKMDNVFDNMIAQTILSQTNKKGDTSATSYQYYQIPCSFGDPPKNFEIMVKRDGSNTKIDPNKTEIIMSMETESLGKISITMDISQKKVIFLFNTQDEETRSLIARESALLRSKLSDINYETAGMRVRVNPAMSSVKQHLINFLSFDHLLRVDTKI